MPGPGHRRPARGRRDAVPPAPWVVHLRRPLQRRALPGLARRPEARYHDRQDLVRAPARFG